MKMRGRPILSEQRVIGTIFLQNRYEEFLYSRRLVTTVTAALAVKRSGN
jgi:hypothetical protein